MSKPWNPRLINGRRARRSAGWPAAWDPYRAHPRRRGSRVTAGEIRLMLAAGVFLGLAVATVPQPVEEGPGFEVVAAGAGSIRVIDGDTFHYDGEKIRIADIDTPEVKSRCAYESALAAQATARLQTLLASGGFELHSIGRDEDRYGRKLRIVTRGGESIGDTLVEEGLARPWTGRRMPWCA